MIVMTKKNQVNIVNDPCIRVDKLKNYSNFLGIWYLAFQGSHRTQVRVIQFMIS